jgi:hypothetical protein
MIFRTKRKRLHIRTVEDAVYHLRYDLLNDALNLHRMDILEGESKDIEKDKLLEVLRKMKSKSDKIIRYNKYLNILRF